MQFVRVYTQLVRAGILAKRASRRPVNTGAAAADLGRPADGRPHNARGHCREK
jgi:hypothetical protein